MLDKTDASQSELLDYCVGTGGPHKDLKIADGSRGIVVSGQKDGEYVRRGVCMPSPCALGCSFDKELVREVGKAVGSIAAREGCGAVLSPDAGVVRSPLCGGLADRFGEDPYLNGVMISEWVKGVQSEGVAAVLNHFAAPDQSNWKFTCDSMIDRRALNEIYLRPFETAVKSARPRAVRCGFNKINGVPVCENHVLLTEILRREWGFEGAVLTDMRTADSAAAVSAGVDMSFPKAGRTARTRVKKAIAEGEIPAHYLRSSAHRAIAMTEFAGNDLSEQMTDDECHALAVKAAEACAVLLKNNRSTLPLPLSGSIALIGRQAAHPRIQRRGMSALDDSGVKSVLDVFEDNRIRYKYCEGWGDNSAADNELLTQAVSCAAESEFAVVFVGFDDAFDNRSADRFSNKLPKSQIKLITSVSKVNPNTVIVVGGSALPKMSWVGKVKAVIYMPLCGEGTAEALYNLIFGFTDPCGRLSVSYSLNENDMPCRDTFGAGPEASQYRESIYVGYRYYNKAGIYAVFPFGYGLSYTEFEYSRMRVKECAEGFEVTVDVKNVGKRDGSEIVQFYTEPPKGEKFRAVRELKQFRKVFLAKGEKRTVSAVIPHSAFESYSLEYGRFRAVGGRYRVYAAASSSDMRECVWVTVKGEPAAERNVPEWYLNPTGRPDESDFLDIFGEPTTAKSLPDERGYSVDDPLSVLSEIGVFAVAVKIIRFIADFVIRAGSRVEPEYAERLDIVLNMPVRRLSGLCKGLFPMKLTKLIIGATNSLRRKRR